MLIELTDRGRGVAGAIRAAAEAIDAELAEMLTPAEPAGFRAGLEALSEIMEQKGKGT
jgi:DNA-binding MarR family transcriptional regulator